MQNQYQKYKEDTNEQFYNYLSLPLKMFLTSYYAKHYIKAVLKSLKNSNILTQISLDRVVFSQINRFT